jgi:phenylalanyl-tRNA synthetase beta subunit
MKNCLSEELTHLKNSLIPHLLQSLEENKRDFEKLRLFEIEKIFHKTNSNIDENYSL